MAREVSLQGWDTANVVTLDVLNKAIAAQNTTPATFTLTEGLNSIKRQVGTLAGHPRQTGQNSGTFLFGKIG